VKLAVAAAKPSKHARTSVRGWIATFWQHPRKTFLRRVLFQVHLWSGIGIGLIATVVGISGSAIVYKDSLDRIFTPGLFRTAGPGPRHSIDQLLGAVHADHPATRISYVTTPPDGAPWVFYLSPAHGPAPTHLTLAYYDPTTGRQLGAIGESSGVMNWMAELHFRLLGGTTGTLVNGIGGFLLLLLCITGLVIWWPGRKRLRSGLVIEWRARWPRLNWDLHSVIGFWLSIPLAIEAFTGAYYCFFVPMASALVLLLGGSVHQWQIMSVPPRSSAAITADVAFEPLIEKALALHPDCKLRGIASPIAPTDPFSVQLDPPHAEDYGQYVQVVFDRHTGALLSDVDSRKQSLAIQLVLFIRPLHFGTFAGQWSRIAWILVGFAPALLFVTGFIMWWRRVPARMLRARTP
jgi:uncharacterized iron-regulated membrane protein